MFAHRRGSPSSVSHLSASSSDTSVYPHSSDTDTEITQPSSSDSKYIHVSQSQYKKGLAESDAMLARLGNYSDSEQQTVPRRRGSATITSSSSDSQQFETPRRRGSTNAESLTTDDKTNSTKAREYTNKLTKQYFREKTASENEPEVSSAALMYIPRDPDKLEMIFDVSLSLSPRQKAHAGKFILVREAGDRTGGQLCTALTGDQCTADKTGNRCATLSRYFGFKSSCGMTAEYLANLVTILNDYAREYSPANKPDLPSRFPVRAILLDAASENQAMKKSQWQNPRHPTINTVTSVDVIDMIIVRFQQDSVSYGDMLSAIYAVANCRTMDDAEHVMPYLMTLAVGDQSVPLHERIRFLNEVIIPTAVLQRMTRLARVSSGISITRLGVLAVLFQLLMTTGGMSQAVVGSNIRAGVGFEPPADAAKTVRNDYGMQTIGAVNDEMLFGKQIGCLQMDKASGKCVKSFTEVTDPLFKIEEYPLVAMKTIARDKDGNLHPVVAQAIGSSINKKRNMKIVAQEGVLQDDKQTGDSQATILDSVVAEDIEFRNNHCPNGMDDKSCNAIVIDKRVEYAISTLYLPYVTAQTSEETKMLLMNTCLRYIVSKMPELMANSLLNRAEETSGITNQIISYIRDLAANESTSPLARLVLATAPSENFIKFDRQSLFTRAKSIGGQILTSLKNITRKLSPSDPESLARYAMGLFESNTSFENGVVQITENTILEQFAPKTPGAALLSLIKMDPTFFMPVRTSIQRILEEKMSLAILSYNWRVLGTNYELLRFSTTRLLFGDAESGITWYKEAVQSLLSEWKVTQDEFKNLLPDGREFAAEFIRRKRDEYIDLRGNMALGYYALPLAVILGFVSSLAILWTLRRGLRGIIFGKGRVSAKALGELSKTQPQFRANENVSLRNGGVMVYVINENYGDEKQHGKFVVRKPNTKTRFHVMNMAAGGEGKFAMSSSLELLEREVIKTELVYSFDTGQWNIDSAAVNEYWTLFRRRGTNELKNWLALFGSVTNSVTKSVANAFSRARVGTGPSDPSLTLGRRPQIQSDDNDNRW